MPRMPLLLNMSPMTNSLKPCAAQIVTIAFIRAARSAMQISGLMEGKLQTAYRLIGKLFALWKKRGLVSGGAGAYYNHIAVLQRFHLTWVINTCSQPLAYAICQNIGTDILTNCYNFHSIMGYTYGIFYSRHTGPDDGKARKAAYKMPKKDLRSVKYKQLFHMKERYHV